MQQVYPVREEKQDEIPAVTHVDGTGRLQAVGKDRNPAYHTLISAFAEKTGTPVVLNTSFNENEPIVESPPSRRSTASSARRWTRWSSKIHWCNGSRWRPPRRAPPRTEAADLEGDAGSQT